MTNALLLRRRGMMIAQETVRPNYLMFTALQNQSTVTLSKTGSPYSATFEISMNEGAFQPYTFGTAINLDNGETVEFRNTSTMTAICRNSTNYYKFAMSGLIAASGNIMSLLDIRASGNEVTSDGLRNLFQNCAALKTPPELPATILNYARPYAYTFDGSGITYAPELPAESITNQAYYNMFKGCTAMIHGGKISAKTLGTDCFYGMFDGCSNCLDYDFDNVNAGTNMLRNNSSCSSFTIHAVTPPTIGGSTITGLKSDCAIYVPAGSVAAYQAATYWSARAAYIQAIPNI